MERLKLAIRRYEDIVPDRTRALDMPLPILESWLEEDVCAAVEEIIELPSFREQASSPISSLRAGADSADRELIDNLARQLKVAATQLSSLLNRKRLQHRLRANAQVTSFCSSEAVRIDGSGFNLLSRENERVNLIEELLLGADTLSKLVRAEFVNIHDYFEPTQEYAHLPNSKEPIQYASWIDSVNPELLPVGNFVVRCMLKRFRIALEVLNNYVNEVISLSKLEETTLNAVTEFLDNSWTPTRHAWDQFLDRFTSNKQNRSIDSFVIATQVYAACHRSPQLEWLGLSHDVIAHGREQIRHRMRGHQAKELFDRIAVALADVNGWLVQLKHSGTAAIEQAIAGGGLVLILGKQEAYFAEKTFDELTRGEFSLLKALAKKAPRRQPVNRHDIRSENEDITDSALSSAWGRLKRKSPREFKGLVVPGNDTATYVLTLEGHKIHIFN